ncbi:transposase [Streptomyces sp. NPDC087659]|uniref:transposase n=1 Tax=Streptomyces sp. NPDC087659 TaxID=3365801 RepID=UPI00381F2F61
MSGTTIEQIPGSEPTAEAVAASDEQLVAMLVDRARSEGLQLTGEGGLLQQLTKRVLESALEGEITDHLGYEKHDAEGRGSGNSRNGTRAKTVLTDVGPVEVKVPRDMAGTFEPAIVKKRQRGLSGGRDGSVGLREGPYARRDLRVPGRGLRRERVQGDHLHDKVMDGMAEWSNRTLDRVYPALFVDAINVKIRVLATIL